MMETFKCTLTIIEAALLCIFIASFFLMGYSSLCMDPGPRANKLNRLATKVMTVSAAVFVCVLVVDKAIMESKCFF